MPTPEPLYLVLAYSQGPFSDKSHADPVSFDDDLDRTIQAAKQELDRTIKDESIHAVVIMKLCKGQTFPSRGLSDRELPCIVFVARKCFRANDSPYWYKRSVRGFPKVTN